jgi:hypothetical protein
LCKSLIEVFLGKPPIEQHPLTTATTILSATRRNNNNNNNNNNSNSNNNNKYNNNTGVPLQKQLCLAVS